MISLYYYTGRGNSLHTAKAIAARLGDTKLIRIKTGTRQSFLPPVPRGAIGLVLPVIDLGIPLSVRKFVMGLSCGEFSPYVFAAVTTGGLPAGVLGQLRSLLSRRGFELSAAALFPFSLKPEDETVRNQRLDELCAAVAVRAPLDYGKGSLFERLILTGAGNSAARRIIPREDRKFSVTGSCDGCGICARLCPSRNIELVDEKPRWKGHCEQCGACFAWCPQEAVTGTCMAAKTRYRNPQIILEDLLDSWGGPPSPGSTAPNGS